MKKSIFLFLGGTVFGAAVVAFLLNSGVLYDNPESQSLSGNRRVQSGGPSESVEKYATLAPASKANNSSQNYLTYTDTRSSSPNGQLPMIPSAISVPVPGVANVVQQAREPEPPTPEQLERYRTMQNSLHSAAYNHTAVLAELTQQSNKLTPEQRQKLTDEAMEMIKRGELKAEQFMPQPGS